MSTLNQGTIIVNNEVVLIKPNSLTFTNGTGEAMVRAQQAGGGAIETVSSVNGETMISTVKFDLLNTISSSDLVDAWSLNKIRSERFVIQFIYNEKTYTVTNAILTNNVEYQDSNDGSMSCEFAGDAMVSI